MGKLTRTLEWFKRHSRAITLFSAAMLAVFGLVLLTDSLPTLTARMSDALRSNGFGWLVDAGLTRWPTTSALAERIHDHLVGEPGSTERKMFGGVAYMVDGNVCVGIWHDELIARVGDRRGRTSTGAGRRPRVRHHRAGHARAGSWSRRSG